MKTISRARGLIYMVLILSLLMPDPSGLPQQPAPVQISSNDITYIYEAGLGVKGQVPCQQASMPGDRGGGGWMTQVSDHSGCGYRNPKCKTVFDVDENCVNKFIETGPNGLGAKQGPWIPVINDCWAFNRHVLASCTKWPWK